MRCRLLAVGALVLLVGGCGSGGESTLGNGGLPTITIGDWTGTRPASVALSGDGGNVVRDISWSSWTATGATGTGRWGYDACVPNCAQGTVTTYAATLRLSEPVGGQFTRLEEQQSGPYGKTYDVALPLQGGSAGQLG